VGALVFGRRAAEADIWFKGGQRARLGELIVVGNTIKRLHASPRHFDVSGEIHDRQVRMFGAAGQDMLKRSKVAVVGLGGIGSLVCEYLTRLGIGELLLVDPDRIEESNLSRVVGARSRDV